MTRRQFLTVLTAVLLVAATPRSPKKRRRSQFSDAFNTEFD